MNRNKFINFMLSDVFTIYSPKVRFNANTVDFGGKYPYVARGSSSNGIRGYITENEAYLNPAKSLSFGQDTATVFYQPKAYFTGDKIKIMILKHHELNEKLALYFITAIKKAFSGFSWGQSSFNENIIKKTTITIPVIVSSNPNYNYTVNDIDWQYMEERITELEQECITELDTYLKVTGLNDYELTEEDKKVLSVSSVIFKKFKLGDLFISSTGDVDLQKKDLNGKGEFLVNSGIENKGIKGKTDRQARIFPPNTITVDFFGNAYYRDFKYKMATHNHVFSLEGSVIKNKYIGLYLEACMSKFSLFFSFNDMATWTKLKKMEISLPVTSNGKPDFDYMEKYIRATEKLVIKDLVDWKNKVIKTTKEVINNDNNTEN